MHKRKIKYLLFISVCVYMFRFSSCSSSSVYTRVPGVRGWWHLTVHWWNPTICTHCTCSTQTKHCQKCFARKSNYNNIILTILSFFVYIHFDSLFTVDLVGRTIFKIKYHDWLIWRKNPFSLIFFSFSRYDPRYDW